MTTHGYAFGKYDKEKMARVVGRDLPISTKQSIEICSFIRGKSLAKAKEDMENTIAMKKPVPFKKFTEGAGHKKGKIAAGKFPVKASKEVLSLLNSLEANAQQKGLSTGNLVVNHICANKASRPPRYGRMRGIYAKRSHIEIVAAESEDLGKKKKGNEKKPQKAAQDHSQIQGQKQKSAEKSEKMEEKKKADIDVSENKGKEAVNKEKSHPNAEHKTHDAQHPAHHPSHSKTEAKVK